MDRAAPSETSPPPCRHLRPRGGAESRVTTVELFFDLVYVFAITQLSHLILGDLSIAGLAEAAFLLIVVWWAWIYTTWMTNWFDPSSAVVRTVLTGVMLASLLLAAALPHALEEDGLLFAGSYVALQAGRNAAAMSLLGREHHLRDIFERLLLWSLVSAPLWLAGAFVDDGHRLLLWVPALALDLIAPAAGYWVPARGRALTAQYDIDGAHFAERCHLFIIIVLGESIVLAGATAADGGLTPRTVLSLVIAFLESVALWWLYFGTPADQVRTRLISSKNPGRLARDAYTYAHVLIVAGIVATAAATNLLLAHPGEPARGLEPVIVLGGPALFLLGAAIFEWMSTGTVNLNRLIAATLVVALVLLGPHVSILIVAIAMTILLTILAISELTIATRSREDAPLARETLGGVTSAARTGEIGS